MTSSIPVTSHTTSSDARVLKSSSHYGYCLTLKLMIILLVSHIYVDVLVVSLHQLDLLPPMTTFTYMILS